MKTLKCTKCGTDNEDSSKFCSNCGAPLNANLQSATQQQPSLTNNREQSIIENQTTQNAVATAEQSANNASFFQKHKGTIIALIAVIAIAILIPIIIVELAGASASKSNVKKYVYTTETGNGSGSYFEVDFDAMTYKYVGSDVYGSPLSGLFAGGTLEVSGSIYYKKTKNGWKIYDFINNPWDSRGYYVSIDEANGILRVYITEIFYYDFKLQE